MRVTLHDYQLDQSLPQKDGVNFAYSEIAYILRNSTNRDLDVRFHNFLQLCQDETYALQVLSDVDCVISNVGPYAHFYFYLRDKLKLNYRIIRDCREAMRSNYLFQEHLNKAYLRDSDTLLFASMYAQQLFFQFYPHLRDFPTVICYPLMRSFPSRRSRATMSLHSKKQVTIGYVGRLSEDKNFPQLIDLIIQLHSIALGRYRLLALGDIHSPSCDPRRFMERIEQETGRNDIFEYYPAVNHDFVWDFYNQIDVLLFPSTSNIETFGRVLIEASYCGIPIIGSDHAAAPELLPQQALVPVSYSYGKRFSTHFDFPLGRVDIGNMVTKLETGEVVPSNCHQAYRDHANLFLRVVTQGNVSGDSTDAASGRSQPQQEKRFIKSVRLTDMPESRDLHETNALMQELLSWFCWLQEKDSMHYRSRLDKLLSISKYPERTLRYIDKSLRSRGDFTNVGGIDFELCHVVGFYPSFELVSLE
jgi:glycosyltransferase involved in cell wall biosynthesis